MKNQNVYVIIGIVNTPIKANDMSELEANFSAALKPKNHRNSRPRVGKSGEPAPLQPVFSTRIEPEVKDEADAWIQRVGWTKRQFTEYAFETVMRSLSEEEARAMNIRAAKLELNHS